MFIYKRFDESVWFLALIFCSVIAVAVMMVFTPSAGEYVVKAAVASFVLLFAYSIFDTIRGVKKLLGLKQTLAASDEKFQVTFLFDISTQEMTGAEISEILTRVRTTAVTITSIKRFNPV